MAIVNQYTIIYFTLMVHGSMSFSFDKNLCLETVARFLYNGGICDFNKSTALSFLKDVTTCPNTCNVQISNLNRGRRYSLKSIALMTGSERKKFNTCSNSQGYLDINCSSWNTREYITWDKAYACSINDAQCINMNRYCICHCMPGYILEGKKCLKKKVNIGGTCERNWQCKGTAFAVCDHDVCSCSPGYMQIGKMCYPVSVTINGTCDFNLQCNGTEFASVCDHGSCLCSPGYIQIDGKCYPGNLGINDFCELQEQCIQPFSGCFNGSCKCKNGYSAFNTDSCLKDQPNSLGSSNSQQYGTNIGVTVGSLFGGFILGVIVTAVVTTLMYRRLNIRTQNRKEPDAMFVANRECGAAGGAQISFTNNKKQNVATLSPYSFAKETQGYNLSSKQEDERTDDVYNHLHEQTEQDDDNYDHACAVTNHITDLSDYSNIHDAATFQTSPSKDGDDYSTLRN